MAFEGCLELKNGSDDDVPSISFPTKTGGKQLLFNGTRKNKRFKRFFAGGQHTRWVCLKTASPENLIDLLPKFRQFEVLFEGHLPFLKLI